jgi:hypothetical protein
MFLCLQVPESSGPWLVAVMAAIPGKLRSFINPVLFADEKNKLQVNL